MVAQQAAPSVSTRRGGWINTFSGKAVYPLSMSAGDVDIRDIAHALSLQCRYGGQCGRFYCPTPDQRVLTADLRWVPAGDLRVGDELVGFDEHPVEPGSTGKRRRRYRHSQVTAAQPVKATTYRLEMADGSTVTASSEHPWLVATKASGNQCWRSTGALVRDLADGRRRYMHRFMLPWSTGTTRDDGWLAGLYDGEGHLSFIGRKGVQMGVAQRPGAVLDYAASLLAARGFGVPRISSIGERDVVSLQVPGGWREIARLLGSLRPMRLLSKFEAGLRGGHLDKQIEGQGEPLEIVRAYASGEQWVAGLETTTHTYLCEGYGAHNSVAEHSYIVSRIVEAQYALWALLHDASEAYLVDIPRPVKTAIVGYKEAESAAMACVVEHFDLRPAVEPAPVKLADERVLHTERDTLFAAVPQDWCLVAPRVLGLRLYCWSPDVAERMFLQRFDALMALRSRNEGYSCA